MNDKATLESLQQALAEERNANQQLNERIAINNVAFADYILLIRLLTNDRASANIELDRTRRERDNLANEVNRLKGELSKSLTDYGKLQKSIQAMEDTKKDPVEPSPPLNVTHQ